MKQDIKVLGIDDGAFTKGQKERVPVIGAIIRGHDELEGVLSCSITPDGMDATQNVEHMIISSPHRKQLKAVMINGTTLAGFNIVDIKLLSQYTRLPVIAIFRKRPDFVAVNRALKHLPNYDQRTKLIEWDEMYKYRGGYFQCAGITSEDATRIINRTLRKSNVPEPVRVAHMIASGITVGHSTKRA